jgi:hypothetical protein
MMQILSPFFVFSVAFRYFFKKIGLVHVSHIDRSGIKVYVGFDSLKKLKLTIIQNNLLNTDSFIIQNRSSFFIFY